MKSIQGIKLGLRAGHAKGKIARKIFLSYPTEAFLGLEELEFSIKEEIREKLAIDFTTIQFCGSSKTGLSFVKNKPFNNATSDLDVAIIDLRYLVLLG